MIKEFLLLSLCLQLLSACWPGVPSPSPPSPPPPSPSGCGAVRCGVPRSDRNKIVGGQEADKNEYPWQVGLVLNGRVAPFCGGVLLSSKTVLTAAHCYVSPSRFKVTLGEHNLLENDGQQLVSVSSFYRHPGYNSQTQDNDFAIIRLSSHVGFSNSIQPICLPNPGTSYDNRVSTVTGWGTLFAGADWSPAVLNEVNVNTMTNAQCTGSSTDYLPSDITSNMLCAAAPGKDSCQGDSGGPLITLDGNSFSLIGITSWGFGCAQASAPGVYSRVTSQLPWIQNQIRGTTCPR